MGIIWVFVAVVVLLGGGYAVTHYEGGTKSNMNIKTESDVVTEEDILTATYPIQANFDGKFTTEQNVVFPKHSGNIHSEGLTGFVFINKANNLSLEFIAGTEGFQISSYKFTDETHQKAIVNVMGNYGASGNDNRVYEVSKVNGKVIVKDLSL